MQVSVEIKDGLKRQMVVIVPPERVESAVEKRIKELIPTAKLPGFRQGKVPKNEVVRRYGSQVRQEVLGQVLQETFYDAVREQNLQIVGVPEITPQTTLAGQPLQYVANFEVFPEFSLVDLRGVTISTPVVELQDSDIDFAVETLRKQHTQWLAVDRPAQQGDQVIMDYHGTLDGQEFHGGTGSAVPVVLGSRVLIPGFEEGLLGLAVGAEKTLELTFPEKYNPASLAGKSVKFLVNIVKVSAPQLPPLDDSLAVKFAIKEGGLAALRQEVRSNLERSLEQAIRLRIRNQVIEKMLELNQVDIPQGLVENEVDGLRGQVAYQYAGKSKELAKKLFAQLPAENFREQAQKNVKIGLIFGKMIREKQVTADPLRVRKRINLLAASYEQPEEMVKWYYGDKDRLAEIQRAVVEDQVIDALLEHAAIHQQIMSYAELMNIKSTEVLA